MAGVLQDDRHRNFRISIGSKAGKEGMIPVVGGYAIRLPGLLVLGHPDDLGSPRFSGDVGLFPFQDRPRPPRSFTTPHRA